MRGGESDAGEDRGEREAEEEEEEKELESVEGLGVTQPETIYLRTRPLRHALRYKGRIRMAARSGSPGPLGEGRG